MKSLEELVAIRDRMKGKVVIREGSGEIRVVVGMATCGIAAGARPVLNAFVEKEVPGRLSKDNTLPLTTNGVVMTEAFEKELEGIKDKFRTE